MKKKDTNMIMIIFLLLMLGEILWNRELIFKTVAFSLNTWVKNIVPSLFPFFVLSDLLIHYNIVRYIPARVKLWTRKLFRISEASLLVMFLSMMSGFPSNARNARLLYEQGALTKEEASYILMFTHFANPLFILGTVAIFFLNNKTYGVIILISHYLANFILGLLLRGRSPWKEKKIVIDETERPNLGIVFAESVKKAVDTLLMIVGTLTCFLILSTIIINRFKLDLYSSALIKGILEMTMGLKELAGLKIANVYKVVISTMFLSFGGLSVHMQVISTLVGTDIDVKPFMMGRVYQAVISGILAFVLFKVM